MKTFDLLTLARRMIAIDTRSSVSNIRLVEFLLPLCQDAGLKTSLQKETRQDLAQYNLLASRGPIDADTLLLATHTDTVPPGEFSLWTATAGDPFSLTQHDGVLYGLGVADVKLDLLCKLLALNSLRNTDLRRNVALAATYGEETGRYGAKLLVSELRKQGEGRLPRSVLVGEPTGLRPCTAHKGYVEFRIEGSDSKPQRIPSRPFWRFVFEGIAAHSSQPHRGASANTACLDALISLERRMRILGIHGPLEIISVRGGDAVNKVAERCETIVAVESAPPAHDLLTPESAAAGITCFIEPVLLPQDTVRSERLGQLLFVIHSLTRSLNVRLGASQVAGFDPTYSTVNNGLVNLDQANLSYVLDVRSVPADLTAQAIDEHETALRALKDLAPISRAGLQVRIERVLESQPFQASDDSPILSALMAELAKYGLPLQREIKSGTTEAPVYQGAGMDTIVFGPGQAAGNIHRPNEHVPLGELYRCVEIYRDLILRLCRN